MNERQSINFVQIEEVVRACHHRMGSPLGWEQLMDIQQEVAIAVWRSRTQFEGRSSVETWVFGIARLKILTQLRRQRTGADHLAAYASDPVGGQATQPQHGTSLHRVLHEALERSGSTIVEIFRKHHVRGWTFQRIAMTLRRSEAALKSRYYRALPHLKRVLQGLDWGR